MPNPAFDAVIKIEEVKVYRNPSGKADWIEIMRVVQPGENIRNRASDFSSDSVLIPAGTRIGPEHLMAGSAVGVRTIPVIALPRIAVVSTGSELVPADTEELQPGLIRNSTAPFLQSALKAMGLESTYFGIVRDDPETYRKTLDEIRTRGFDLVISTGAVSMGQLDFVSDVLRDLDSRIHFHKVAIRPGKPLLFATLSGEIRPLVFFGVPGNPVSTAVALRFFIDPFLRGIFRLKPEAPLTVPLSEPVKKPRGLTCFYKGRIRLREDRLEARTLQGQASYIVSSLLESNSWIELPEADEEVTPGTRVRAYPLHSFIDDGVES